MRVLWNGEPTEKFYPSRGIRQGDPLSPYIFVACMERLSHLIEEAVNNGRWKPVLVARNGPSIHSLFFANDIVLFAEATPEQGQVIKECLDRFCIASGQKVSEAKSRVFFSRNTPSAAIVGICDTLSMAATEDLGKYLGIPVLNGRVTRVRFQYIINRIDRKLAGWKTRCLSLAGSRLCHGDH